MSDELTDAGTSNEPQTRSKFEVGDLDLEALREVVANGTPGPWSNLSHSGSWEWWIKRDTGGWDGDILCIFEDGEVHSEPTDADMDLIVAAVNALPVLLDEVQRLRDELERAYTFGTDSGL